MGYSTDFDGAFKLNKRLKFEDHKYLQDFAAIRHMKRKGLDPKYGVDGEFYVGVGTAIDDCGQADNLGVIDFNHPSSTQPGLWCQWVPTEDGQGIEWDGNEKFYSYVEWLTYLIDKILAPRGYVLDGEVAWQGEDSDDRGKIVVKNNAIKTLRGRTVYAE